MMAAEGCVPYLFCAGLLLTGTTGKIHAYCKDLIDTAGKGGSYIMALGTAMDEGNAETLHALVDYTVCIGRRQDSKKTFPELCICRHNKN